MFFGGNVNVNSKLGGNCGAQLAICIFRSRVIRACHVTTDCIVAMSYCENNMFLAPEQTANLFPTITLYIPFERLVCTAISSEKSWHPKKQK